MIPKAKLYASEEEVHNAWVEWSKFRVCARCGTTYNLLSSFGAWQCKQHLCRPSARVEGGERVYRYWECCRKKPYTLQYCQNERIWRDFRTKRYMPEANELEGCIPCDHTENFSIVDDGVRMNQSVTSLAPLGGFKVNDKVLYQGNECYVQQVYYDNSVDLQDIEKSRIPANELVWPNASIETNGFYNWNNAGGSFPVKILKKSGSKIDVCIQDQGVAVHDIAAMIPHMKGDPTTRPGWQFEKVNGKVLFPYIKQSSSSFRTKTKLSTK